MISWVKTIYNDMFSLFLIQNLLSNALLELPKWSKGSTTRASSHSLRATSSKTASQEKWLPMRFERKVVVYKDYKERH
jgi:hypothetical protein